MPKTTRESPLLKAVEALDEELQRFEHEAATALRVPLTSERNLEKAARSIGEAAASQKRVSEHIAALISAIQTAQRQHDETAERVIAIKHELEARAAVVNAQRERFATLGKEAAEISALVRELGQKGQTASPETVRRLSEVAERMGRVAGEAEVLTKEATQHELPELARQCDSLRQQVQSALNKVTLVRDKLATTIN